MTENIINLYNEGFTIRQISEKLNQSYESIRKILKSQKVKWRKNYITDFTPNQITDIVNKYKNGMKVKELAKWYEISAPAISRILKFNNVDVTCSMRKYDILRETPINKIQKEFIVGTLLGDGCLHKDSAKSNFKLSIGQCEKQEQYFHWKIAMMDPFINGFNKSIDKRGNSTMLQTKTITHKDLNFFADMFYPKDRIKIVPNNLDMYLTPLALATWIQDDGNLNMGVNMRISSQGFTEQDNYKLRDYLKQCFDLRSKVMNYKYNDKNYYMITLNKENTQKLSDIIRPHVVDCMKYKLMPESSTTLR